jgi:chloride channel protein, CIC family
VTASSPQSQVHGWTYLRLVLLGALIGVPAALVAAGFLGLVHYLQHWIWDDLPDALGYSSPPWFLVVLLPVVGAAIVVVARTFFPGDGGHSPLEGLGGGPAPPSHAFGIALAAIATLAFGAVLGPEAPLVALGAVVALVLTSFARLDQRESAVLSTSGAFAAVAAVFGGPIVAGVLMVESAAAGLGAAMLPVLLPGFVAAAVGYVIIIGFGDWGGLDVPGLAVPSLPQYEGTHVTDLLLAVVVGVAAALVVVVVRTLATRVARDGRERLGMPALLVTGGLAVGVLAVLADALGANSQDVLFSGQASVPTLVAEDSTSIVFVLLAAKALAFAVCLGCGFRGGFIFPAIFLGIGLATLAVIWFDVSPTWAIAAGAAAGMAAMSRLLLSSIVFAALLTGTAGLDAVPAAVLAAAAAWLTATALEHRASPALVPEAPA